MKIALLLTGQIRNAKECFPSIQEHILEPYDTDVYINTWLPENNIPDHRNNIIDNDCSVNDLISMYSPTKISIEDFNSSFCNKIVETSSVFIPYHKETNSKNVFFQYYKILSGFSLIADYQDYDMIIRGRFDLLFKSFPNLEELSKEELYIPKGWDHREGTCDLLSFGNPLLMKKYCSLYSNLLDYLKEGCILHPEVLLKYHLDKMNISSKRVEMEYYLRNRLIE